MVDKDSLILVPISTKDTLTRLRRKIVGLPIINRHLINIKPDHHQLITSLDRVIIIQHEHDNIFSIFTSKNSVKILLNYIYNKNLLDKYRFLFEKVVCIGPATLNTLRNILKHYIPDFKSIFEAIPRNHNSLELIKILEYINGVPILWSSKYAENILKKYIISRGGLSIQLYDIELDINSLQEIFNNIKGYEEIYLIFMSRKSLEALKYLSLIEDSNIYGIFISERVCKEADVSRFKEVYVYQGGNIDDFYKFVRRIVS